jgi:hypothetical protein
MPPLPFLLPGTLFVVTITLVTLTIFVIALIIAHMLSSFAVAYCHGRVVIDALLPATAHL